MTTLSEQRNALLNRWQQALSLPSLLLFVVLACLFFFYADRPVALFFNQHPIFDSLSWTAAVGKSRNFILLFLLLASLLWVKKDKAWALRCLFMSIWMTLSYGLCVIFKITLGRARPELWLSDHTFGFTGFQMNKAYWSFPSGHTTAFMSLAVGLAFFFPKYARVILLAGVLLSLSRVVLVFHYLSDVFVTAVLIFALFVCCLSWLRKQAIWSKLV